MRYLVFALLPSCLPLSDCRDILTPGVWRHEYTEVEGGTCGPLEPLVDHVLPMDLTYDPNTPPGPCKVRVSESDNGCRFSTVRKCEDRTTKTSHEILSSRHMTGVYTATIYDVCRSTYLVESRKL